MLEVIELLLDFGLLILIWMVQLIIYPSFLYYERKNLINWHNKYTGLIAVIVAPLMFGQLGFTIYGIANDLSITSVIKIILIAFVWIFTFAYFAPTHKKISKGDFSTNTLIQLIKLNWVRTISWTLVFILVFITLEK